MGGAASKFIVPTDLVMRGPAGASGPRPCIARGSRELASVAPDHERTCRAWWTRWRDHGGDALDRPAFRATFGAALALFREPGSPSSAATLARVGAELRARAVGLAQLVLAARSLREVLLWELERLTPPADQRWRDALALGELADSVHCALGLTTVAPGTTDANPPSACRNCPLLQRPAATTAPVRLDEPKRHAGGLVGSSVPMQDLYGRLAMLARGRGAVLILGESGTGKELVARGIHELSAHRDGPFVAVNVAALPRDLIEGELFGHAAGAYTGARAASVGLVRAAQGGTLLLDEITEMPVELQAKLLRVIEGGCVRPVGATAEVPVRVRFLASSNRDPHEAITAGFLRRDLYYRLATYQIQVAPLRERREDLPELLAHFAALFAADGLRRVTSVEQGLLDHLGAQPFLGNVRELRAIVEWGLAAGDGSELALADLPPTFEGERQRVGVPTVPPPALGLGEGDPTSQVFETVQDVMSVDEMEADLIRRALEATAGNKSRAAALLGISRHRLYARLSKPRAK